ncbi:MAG TPA: 1,6-anhydro-N-acetylmuramyl-L-alanine amidase AmpD [Pseudomonadales bacterium]
MLHVKADHWLARVRRRPSPNQGPRPDPNDISLVVIHGISLPPGSFGTGLVEDLFLNRLNGSRDARLADLEDVRVSAHLFIDRRGRVTQFVPFHERAWHAGVSCWRGREGCNDFSIGIELEGEDERPYTRSQYRRLQLVLAALFARYPRLSRAAVVGHQEIAPGRKTDPGPAFDWHRLLAALW